MALLEELKLTRRKELGVGIRQRGTEEERLSVKGRKREGE